MMDKKIDIQFDKDLDYIIQLKGELVQAETLIRNGAYPLDKYRGACYLLENYLNKYENLSDNAKKHLDVNVSELERKAVETLVTQGHSDIVSKERLKKFGYPLEKNKK